jgi:hypothetical protein
MGNFEMVEAGLHRDVLGARAGVLRNYDPLVRETDALDVTVGNLQQITALDAATRSAIDRLAMAVTRQEQFVEQFKSDNALLQNSLAYFALFSSDWHGPLAQPVSSLATAMLRLTLDTTAARARGAGSIGRTCQAAFARRRRRCRPSSIGARTPAA